MADVCDVSKIVTSFLLNTCRLHQRLSISNVQAAVHCDGLMTAYPLDDEEADYIPQITGSVAEFYIEPMLSHLGDIDLMYYTNNELAIPEGDPAPTQLPAEFHNYVRVSEIIDSHLPGYVYLPLRYLLTKRINDGKYEYIEYVENHFFGTHL